MKALVHTWDSFNYHWTVWRFFGLDPPAQGYISHRLYYIFTTFINISVTLTFPISMIIQCCLSRNVHDFCESSFGAITDLMCTLKFVNVCMVHRKLLQMRSTFEELDERAQTTNEQAALREGKNSAARFFKNFSTLVIIAIVTNTCVICLASDRILMYPAYFPWDFRYSRSNFFWALSYQLFCMLVHGMQEVGNDTYPQAFLVVLTAHIKALRIRIEMIGNTQPQSSTFINLAQMQQRNYEDLIACIKDHKIIIQLFTTIQKALSTACLAQFICTGLAQCTVGVYMLYVGLDLSELMHLAAFFTIVTSEILILCYYGDLLCQENERLSMAIYSCRWVDQNKHFKSALLLLLQRSQRADLLMAGNFIPVQLSTFVQVIKMAYSAFTVLQKVSRNG